MGAAERFVARDARGHGRRTSTIFFVSTGRSWAGAWLSASGRTLVFNVSGRARFDEPAVEGMTCAVTGPWHRGPL